MTPLNSSNSANPDAIQAAYDKVDPLLSPRWRWHRALSLAQLGRLPSRQHHDAWIWRAYRYVCQRRGRRGPKITDAQRWLDAIGTAWTVYRHRNLDRAILQARLLAQEPTTEIATRSGLSSDVVMAFTRLFFDVESRIVNKSWIVHQAIRFPVLPKPATLGAVLRKFGYFAEAGFLEQMIPIARKFAAQPLRTEPIDMSTEAGRAEAAIRRILLLETVKLTERKALTLFRLHAAMIAEAHREDRSETQTSVWPPEDVLLAGMAHAGPIDETLLVSSVELAAASFDKMLSDEGADCTRAA